MSEQLAHAIDPLPTFNDMALSSSRKLDVLEKNISDSPQLN